MSEERSMTVESARSILAAMAEYFERRPTGGEDSAHWSNVYNAENCRIISRMVSAPQPDPTPASTCGIEAQGANEMPMNWPTAIAAWVARIIGRALCLIGLHSWRKYYRASWNCKRCLKLPH